MNLNSKYLISFIFFVFAHSSYALDKSVQAYDKTSESKNIAESLPIHFRLAFMFGHVEVGIELYKLNELKMAAPHLLHPVSETHKSERDGLEELGFKSFLFEEVSLAIETKKPASEVKDLLTESRNNLSFLSKKVGGDPIEIIKFLLKTSNEEYNLAFTSGKLKNFGEYQDAWGFVVVAINQSKRIIDKKISENLTNELNELLDLWVKGPLPTNSAKNPIIISSKIEKILSFLNQF